MIPSIPSDCNNTPCNPIPLEDPCNPCNNCDYCGKCACECLCEEPQYETGCAASVDSDCVIYSGVDVPSLDIENGDILTDIIENLSTNIVNIYNNGGGGGTGGSETSNTAIDTNSIDISLSGLYNRNISASLRLDPTSTAAVSITPQGLKVDNNVPDPVNVFIQNVPGISFQRMVSGNVITFKPILDINYIANLVCAICANGNNGNPTVCPALQFSTSSVTATSFVLSPTSLPQGNTYDVSIDGGASYPYTLQTTNNLSITGLTPNTTYQIVVRHNCANNTSINTGSVSTLSVACPAPTNLNVTMS